MPEYVLRRAHEAMAENGITDPSKVGIYGLTYKEDVDDVRESPTCSCWRRRPSTCADPP